MAEHVTQFVKLRLNPDLSLPAICQIALRRIIRWMTQAPETRRAIPTRRWFQLHLSTIVVLTLLAGWLLWMNLRVYDGGCGGISMTGYITWSRIFSLGWPESYVLCQRIEAVEPLRESDISCPCPPIALDPPTVTDLLNQRSFSDKECFWDWSTSRLVGNLFAALALLAAAAVVLEWLLRRLHWRRSNPHSG
jgi:hypothetical protein